MTETLKNILSVVALTLPFIVSVALAWRMIKNRATDWKLATCVSGMAVVTCLLFLMASERVAFVRYGEAMLQVNEKAEQVKKLTEENKQMAKLTAKAIMLSQKGPIMADGYNAAVVAKPLEELLKAAGTPEDEINQILERTNSPPKK